MDFQTFYDNWATEELEHHARVRREIATWKAHALLAILPATYRAQSIAEIGCAEGHILNILAEKLQANERIGYELASPFIQEGRIRYPEITFLQGDFQKSPPRHRVDLAIIADVLEHIPNPHMFLQKTQRVAKQVLIKMPLEWSLLDNIVLGLLGKKTYPSEHHAEGHLWEARFGSFIAFLKRAGMTILATRFTTPPITMEYPTIAEQRKPSNILRYQAHKLLPASLATVLVGGHCIVWGSWKD